MKFKQSTTIFLFLILSAGVFAQTIVQDDEPNQTRSGDFLGIRLRSEIQAIVKEIERKCNKKILAEFINQKEFMLGSSYISDAEGIPVVLIDYKLEDDAKKLEAVAAHELLHLRLRVNNYPTFLFSPTVQTAKGRAVDVEQSTANDLLSLIEHRIFKSEMERFGLNKLLDLAGDTAKVAKRRRGEPDEQSDSINYARAILEYPNQKDVEEVARIYKENNWTRALESGKRIADFISQSNLQTPAAVEAVFLKCIMELYRPPSTHTFKLTVDPQNKFFRRMIIGTARRAVQRRKRG
ncbi:MAG: hypothetical protein LH614_16415 [Pyrinomonadaceae bacterium]|nr:hypothetical protein [Pyrinomonadaceae bacterium]